MDEKPIQGPNPPFPEILRVEVGSTIHGIGLESKDDRDEMGVCVEPPEYVVGLEVFEQYEYRTARERTGVREARSQPGDLDLTVYSLRKYLRLAIKGNPTVMLLLFALEDRLVIQTPLGKELQELAPAIASRSAGSSSWASLQPRSNGSCANEGRRGSRRGMTRTLSTRRTCCASVTRASSS